MPLINFVLSAWVFFFRFPAFKLKKFYPNAIILAGFVQMPVFLGFAALFRWLFRLGHIDGLPYALFGWLALALLTGLFHEDGLSDLFDSLGVSKFDDSAENLDRIKKAMLDSRLGSFGVHAAVILWLLRYIFSVQPGALLTVALAILASRSIGIAAAVLESRAYSGSPDAKASGYLREIPLWLPLLGLSLVIAAAFVLFFSWQPGIVLCTTSAFMVLLLRAFAKRSGFLNGDMVGGIILLGELFLCLALQFCDMTLRF